MLLSVMPYRAQIILFNDPYIDQVVLGSHFDGSNGGYASTDAGNSTIAVNSLLSNTQAKFGSTSMGFTSNVDVNVTPASNFVFAGDFTIEAWIYVTAWTSAGISDGGYGGPTIFSLGDGPGTNFWSFGLNQSSQLRFYNALSGYNQLVESTTVIPNNTWVHVAASRANNIARVFINGNLEASLSITAALGTSNMTAAIGRSLYDSSKRYFRGFIDELRITRAARYTSSFVVPSAPFSYAGAPIYGNFVLGNRNSILSLVPQLTADSNQGFVLTSSSLYTANAPYWQRYFPFKQDDSGNLVGVGDPANSGFMSSNGVPQFLQIQFPEKTFIERMGICVIRNDAYASPPKDMKFILDGTTTITATLADSQPLSQSNVYVVNINQALQTLKIQTVTNRTGSSSNLMYLHDVVLSGVALDRRSPNLGTLNNSLHDVTSGASNLTFGTRWRAKGKRYFEMKVTQCGGSGADRSSMVGIGTTGAARTGDGVSNASFYSLEFGRNNANLTACRGGNAAITAPAYSIPAAPYWAGILVDFDAGTMSIITPNGDRVDNVYTDIVGNNWFPVISGNGALSGTNSSGVLNFGASAFNFTLPSGYTAWCDADSVEAAFNASDISANVTLSNSNRTMTLSGSGVYRYAHSTTRKGGKYYAEFTVTQATAGNIYIGIDKDTVTSTLPNVSGIWSFRSNGGTVTDGAYAGSGGLSFATGDRIMLAMDVGNGKLWIGKNGTWLGTGNPQAGTNQNMSFTIGFNYRMCVRTETQADADSVTIQNTLVYPAPHGFDNL